MPQKPRGKPPSQRPGRRPGGAHRYRPLRIKGELLDLTYTRTVSPKSPEPVVLLINADEPIGEKLGREIVGSKTFEEIVEDFRRRPEAAAVCLGVESEENAIAILSFSFPIAATAFQTPNPPGHYRVVVVDAGEMTCHSRPIPGLGGTDEASDDAL